MKAAQTIEERLIDLEKREAKIEEWMRRTWDPLVEFVSRTDWKRIRERRRELNLELRLGAREAEEVAAFIDAVIDVMIDAGISPRHVRPEGSLTSGRRRHKAGRKRRSA